MIFYDNDFLKQTDENFDKNTLFGNSFDDPLNDNQLTSYYDKEVLDTNKIPDIFNLDNFNKIEKQNTEIKGTYSCSVKRLNDSELIKFSTIKNIGPIKEDKYKFIGRKRKNDKREAKHTKDREDNKVRKLKTYVSNFIHTSLNQNISSSPKKFLKIDKTINENLKKDFNLSLMQMTIKEIYETYSINGRYSEYLQLKNINEKIIKNIYAKNNEPKVIKILNSKYIDMIKLLRTTYLYQFCSDLLAKEIKGGESIENAKRYVNDLKELLLNYENWFEQKAGRNRKSN